MNPWFRKIAGDSNYPKNKIRSNLKRNTTPSSLFPGLNPTLPTVIIMAKACVSTGSALLPHRSVDHCRTFYSNYHHRLNELLYKSTQNQLWRVWLKRRHNQLGNTGLQFKGLVEVLRGFKLKNNQRNWTRNDEQAGSNWSPIVLVKIGSQPNSRETNLLNRYLLWQNIYAKEQAVAVDLDQHLRAAGDCCNHFHRCSTGLLKTLLWNRAWCHGGKGRITIDIQPTPTLMQTDADTGKGTR